MRCSCSIIPKNVLERFAKDTSLTASDRKAFADTARFETEWRKARAAQGKLTAAAQAMLPIGATTVAAPTIAVYDCQHGRTLPGVPVTPPGDATAARVFKESAAVARFYQDLFGRNSVDGAGKTLLSSVHFSVKYNNAFWNGTQMTYGDGDGKIFVDFTQSTDVIAHELTHGVTQYSAQLGYANEAGGLNESISDVFGSLFRQWRANQTAARADWLIGKEILGPDARARGYTCLRDMSAPAAKHCLSPQIVHYSQYKNGLDPHDSSGVPNLAFRNAAVAIGGKSWEKAGKVWYAALTGSAPQPNMKMKTFANRTRKLAKTMFAGDAAVFTAVDQAWKGVGL